MPGTTLISVELLMRTRLAACMLLGLLLSTPAIAAPDWTRVDAAFGRSGAEQPGGVHRYAFPRSDLTVGLDGVRIKPALALGSWVAFLPHGDEAIVMGDLVLLHEEVNPVLDRLLASGLTISALHNHLLRSQPATMYMHIHGHGDPAKLASAIRSALEHTRTPLSPVPAPGSEPVAFDSAAIDDILGAHGKTAGGVVQYSFPRREAIVDGGVAVPASMGLATAINFQLTTDGKAVATGDFVLVVAEVEPVIRALRDGHIDVTSLHNHLADEQPRLFFLHFWGNGDERGLATGFRQALDRINIVRP